MSEHRRDQVPGVAELFAEVFLLLGVQVREPLLVGWKFFATSSARTGHRSMWTATASLPHTCSPRSSTATPTSNRSRYTRTTPGRGIGRALIDHLAQWARERKIAAMTLTTFTDVPWNGPYHLTMRLTSLANTELTPGLSKIRADEIARGMDEWPRISMRREL
jgi:GNAT superfamily N-acetyltransferase